MRVLNSKTNGYWIVTLQAIGATALCVGHRPSSKIRAASNADHRPPSFVWTGYLASVRVYSPGNAKTLGSRHLR